jgi:hypothetical protein
MPRRLISFDWALKRLLRSKANFDVLEGLCSTFVLLSFVDVGYRLPVVRHSLNELRIAFKP